MNFSPWTRTIAVGCFALLMMLVSSPQLRAAAAPATSSSAADNSSMQDVMKDIDGIAAPSTTQRASDLPATSFVDRPTESAWQHWSGLVRFFAPGLITAGAIGIAAAVVGTFVLLRREAMLALALPQVVATGAALGMRLGWPTLPPAVGFAAIALLYMVVSRRRDERKGHSASSASSSRLTVPVLYVAGLSLSFLIIAGGGAHVEELQNLFTGIDVAVSSQQALIAAPVLLAVALVLTLLWRRWLLLAQAPSAAELSGLRPSHWDLLFLVLLTIVVLVGTDVQGVVLVLAMLFLPAAIVLPWARRIPLTLLAGAAVAIICIAVAFVLSNTMSWPLSQSVGGVGFALFLLSRTAALLLNR